jgi:hypothetical protein
MTLSTCCPTQGTSLPDSISLDHPQVLIEPPEVGLSRVLYAALFVFVAFVMYRGGEGLWVAIPGVLAAVALVWGLLAVLRPPKLTLTTTGYVVDLPFHSIQHAWDEIDGFGIWELKRRRRVIQRSVGVRLVRHARRQPWSAGPRLISGGFDDTMRGTYGMTSAELLLLLETWHSRYCLRS